MAELDSRQLLRSVTRLTEKPDVRALDLALIATLREIIPVTSIGFRQLRENPDVPGQKLLLHATPHEAGADAVLHKAVPLESEPAFAECVRTMSKVVVPDPAGRGVRVIHPVRGRRGVTAFLVVGGEREDPKDQEIVAILLRFYRNYSALLHDSQRDELTGLLNRKTFDEKIVQIIMSQRLAPVAVGDGRGGCCLAVLDIDHFKRVNDQFGHLFGDEILVLFARAMTETFRGADLLFRMGGEEFVVVLREAGLSEALLVLERFRQTIEARAFPQVGRITASIGISLITTNDSPTSVVGRADQALYYAKDHGRNQVHAYEHLLAQGKLFVAKRGTDPEFF